MGMMQSSMSTATLIAGLGVDAVGTRELAQAYPADSRRAARVLSAVTRGMTIVGTIGAAAGFIAMLLLRDWLGLGAYLPILALAVGVFASICTANLRGALSATGHVNSVAASNIAASLVAMLGSAALALLAPTRVEAWAVAVLLVPLAQFVTVGWSFQKVPKLTLLPWGESLREALSLARQSSFLAVAGVLPMLSQLLIRTFARDSLPPESFGCFQASMAIAAISVSVLASSIGPSLLPRLGAAAHDPSKLASVINEQTAIYLKLFAPVAIGLVALPELAVRLLYSSAFDAVADQLSWQMIGEVLRLPSWVLATALTARGRTRTYLLVEAVSLAALVLGTALASTTGNLAIIGATVSIAAAVQFFLLTLLARADGIEWENSVVIRLTLLIGGLILVASMARFWFPVRILAIGVIGVSSWQAIHLLNSARKPTAHP